MAWRPCSSYISGYWLPLYASGCFGWSWAGVGPLLPRLPPRVQHAIQHNLDEFVANSLISIAPAVAMTMATPTAMATAAAAAAVVTEEEATAAAVVVVAAMEEATEVEVAAVVVTACPTSAVA